MKSRSLPAWLKPAPDSLIACAVRRGKSPWAEVIHMAWSVWVFITPAFTPGGYSLRWLLLTLVSYPLFVLLYMQCLLAPRRNTWRYALGMIALAMVLLPVYPACMSYFLFGCIMLRVNNTHSVARYFVQLLLLNVTFIGLAWWVGYPWQSLVWLPAVSMIVGIVINIERASEEKDHELRLSHDEVRRLAATAERERIGRDLHDLLGHTLSLITLKLELSRKLLERDPATARRELEEAERVARHALAEVRSAVTGIRATDLAAELASARLLLESSAVHLDYDPPPPVPPDVERALALVLREAVTNIARHARAGSARIRFTREGNQLKVLVADNGRGGIDADGNGLSGMRERVAKLEGTLTIESPRGQGTRLLLDVPLTVSRWADTEAVAHDAGAAEAAPAAPAPVPAPASTSGHSA